MLRAEMMARGFWWWAVYSDEGRAGCDELDGSNNEGHLRAKTGKEARRFAEIAADRILKDWEDAE